MSKCEKSAWCMDGLDCYDCFDHDYRAVFLGVRGGKPAEQSWLREWNDLRVDKHGGIHINSINCFRLAKADWSNFNEANDYSFDPSKTSFSDWSKVTLYMDNSHVWGIEP